MQTRPTVALLQTTTSSTSIINSSSSMEQADSSAKIPSSQQMHMREQVLVVSVGGSRKTENNKISSHNQPRILDTNKMTTTSKTTIKMQARTMKSGNKTMIKTIN